MIETPSVPKPREGAFLWLFKIVAGLLIVVLLGVHFVVNHLVAPEGLLSYEDVIRYYDNPIFPIMEVFFLVFVIAHALVGLRSILLEIQVAGRVVSRTFSAAPEQSFTYVWDGRDAFGRKVYGGQRTLARVGWVYPAVYQEPAELEQSFGRLSGVPMDGNSARTELTLWRETSTTLEADPPDSTGLGGWGLAVHHSFDPARRPLRMGDGSVRREASLVAQKIETVAGAPEPLVEPFALAAGPDGSVYFAD